MRSETVLKLFTGAFILMFFAYLFGPLIIMSMSAFNSSEFPRVTPWDCFTFEWFGVLASDTRLMDGLKNSLLIGVGVVFLSVPIGLAAAMMLTQVHHRVRPFYYTIVISPILMPGVVLGISTLIFWDRLGTMFDAGYNSVFYDGIFLTVIGQATFISAYSMLVFIARLQRFDPVLEEAALDLGATNVQAFRKVLLPFMKPAIGSAAVLAFLASFENYNTTVFTVISESTLTTVLASKVRYGINPSISSLAVIIVALTLIGAIVFEILKRREMAETEARKREGGAPASRAAKAGLLGNPMAILLVLITIAGLGTAWFASTYDVNACKVELQKERELKTLIESTPGQFLQKKELQEQQRQDLQDAPATQPSDDGQPAEGETKPFGTIFDPNNLQQQVNPEDAPQSGETGGEQDGDAAKPFGSIFDPNNLQQQVNPE